MEDPTARATHRAHAAFYFPGIELAPASGDSAHARLRGNNHVHSRSRPGLDTYAGPGWTGMSGMTQLQPCLRPPGT